jgi:hypothetical protein
MSTDERVQINWQWPLFDVHSIMMIKSAQSGEGGGARPSPFTLSTIASKVVVYALAERANTLLLFLLYHFLLCGNEHYYLMEFLKQKLCNLFCRKKVSKVL